MRARDEEMYICATQCKADFRTVTNEYERNPG